MLFRVCPTVVALLTWEVVLFPTASWLSAVSKDAHLCRWRVETEGGDGGWRASRADLPVSFAAGLLSQYCTCLLEKVLCFFIHSCHKKFIESLPETRHYEAGGHNGK